MHRLRLTSSLVIVVATFARRPVDAADLELRAVLDEYCLGCHDATSPEGDLDLESALAAPIADSPDIWERSLRKLNARQMPPVGKARPDEGTYDAVARTLEVALDAAAERTPDPGRTETFRRLTRLEYENAIRDLLALDIDAEALLPPDESSHGFDNITVSGLSPTLLDRYVSAAQHIARLAVGRVPKSPVGDTIRLRPDLTQEAHVEGLPFGTRGGAVIDHTFPADGEYEVRVRLARDRNEMVEGLSEPHELDILLDRSLVERFEVRPPAGEEGHEGVDAHLVTRLRTSRGPHALGVTFVAKPASLLETKRQPYAARFNMHRHPRTSPAVFQVTIDGPFAAHRATNSPSRRRLLGDARRAGADGEMFLEEEESVAERILAELLRRAYRRPITAADLVRPMAEWREARRADGFDGGLEMAIATILVSPWFLFRIEPDPSGAAPGEVYRLGDVELASRLSFFLWSSLPDDELLRLAERGELSRPEVLDAQVDRLLADPRSRTLVESFASQWLYLRNLESITPDLRLFPDFDHNLRESFRRETQLFVASVFREDRSVLELLRADHTFLDERLARHYGIPHVRGSRFRRVDLDTSAAASVRGGLLRQGSILTVTSYATRTSPVIRGHWLLENLLGAPPPPPPPNVPALEDVTTSGSLSFRERLAEHRSNRACQSCHELMDPVGFALEHYDAVGRWRRFEDGTPIDAAGHFPDGPGFVGVSGIEAHLLARPALFVGTLTEKLLTFALGRGVEPGDGPAVRAIVRRAAANDWRFTSIVHGIVESPPFRMKRSR